MKTQKEFLAYYKADSKIIKAVIKQFGGWELFLENYSGICEHGINGGYGGFIYYSETVKFYEKNKSLIFDLLESQSNEFGCRNIFEFLSFFNLMKNYNLTSFLIYSKNNKNNIDYTQIANLLTWYAAEEVCRKYENFNEN